MLSKKKNINNTNVFLSILLPLAILIFFSSTSIIYSINFISKNEILSNLSSFLIASFVWVLFYNKLRPIIDIKLLNLITCLFLTKTIINFLYIYYFQLNLLDYESSNDYEITAAGDSGLAHVSTLKFISETSNFIGKLFHHVNYYNNKGTLIVYSLIYESFGNFPTNTIPWDSLVVAIYSLIFYFVSGFINNNQKNNLIPIAIFILPAFFFTPLLYRDIYIVLFLSLSLFIVFNNNENTKFYLKFLFIIILSLILFFFRKFYFILPITFFIIYQFFYNIKLRKLIILIVAIFISFLIFYTLQNSELIFTNSAETSLQLGSINPDPLLRIIQYAQLIIIHGERIGGDFVTILENQNFFIKIFLRFCFLLISPFPWIQNIDNPNIIYSFFISLQIFLSFIIYLNLFSLIKSKKLNKNYLLIVIYFFIICLLATFGALQFTHYYIMAGLPILSLTLANIQFADIKRYSVYSFTLAITLHMLYFVAKKFFI